MSLTNVTGAFVGATFVTQIPGTNALATFNNNSAQFVTKDTAIVCNNNSFSIDFSATDVNPDGSHDSLAYSFTPAYDGTNGDNSNPNPTPPPTLSLPTLNYVSPYSGTSPLGAGVTINPNTGIISGIAPPAGNYVICVTVEEWRNGVLLNRHRKDFILRVGDCNFSGAQLTPEVWSCDGFTWTFQNESTSTGISSYLWNFGDNTTSTHPTPTHTYTDTASR